MQIPVIWKWIMENALIYFIDISSTKLPKDVNFLNTLAAVAT